jgi:hypothetical protein
MTGTPIISVESAPQHYDQHGQQSEIAHGGTTPKQPIV